MINGWITRELTDLAENSPEAPCRSTSLCFSLLDCFVGLLNRSGGRTCVLVTVSTLILRKMSTLIPFVTSSWGYCDMRQRRISWQRWRCFRQFDDAIRELYLSLTRWKKNIPKNVSIDAFGSTLETAFRLATGTSELLELMALAAIWSRFSMQL